MPDLVLVFSRWWKFILGVTALAVLVAYFVSLGSPKEYLSTATALPANSLTADKARIFNNNIEALYSDFGTPDELDRLEGTGMLDTLFIAAARDYDLAAHFGTGEGEGLYKAAMRLKKNAKIARSAYGELKVKVWDEDRNLAATLANALMQKIQEIHQHLQNENNQLILQRIEAEYKSKQQQYLGSDSTMRAAGGLLPVRRAVLLEQLQQYEKLIDQYNLALHTNPAVLLTVEPARPSLWPDKPRTAQVLLFTLAAALATTFLVALFLQSRK